MLFLNILFFIIIRGRGRGRHSNNNNNHNNNYNRNYNRVMDNNNNNNNNKQQQSNDMNNNKELPLDRDNNNNIDSHAPKTEVANESIKDTVGKEEERSKRGSEKSNESDMERQATPERKGSNSGSTKEVGDEKGKSSTSRR